MAPPAQPQVDTIDYYKKERDRFVALAFCWADLLLELDRDYKIVFTAGSTAPIFGPGLKRLAGVDLLQRVSPKDRPLFSQMLRGTGLGRHRIENTPIRFIGPDEKVIPLIVAGYCLAEFENHFFLALRMDPLRALREQTRGLKRDKESGLYDIESAAQVTQARTDAGRGAKDGLKMTLVAMEDYQELRERLDEEARQELSRIVGDCLKAGSLSGDTAVQISDTHFGVVRDKNADDDDLTQGIAAVARAADPKAKGVQVKSDSVALDNFAETDGKIAQALLVTLRKIQEDASVVAKPGLLKSLVEETKTGIGEMRDTIEQERFGIAFQPVFNMQSRTMHHFEALARFPDQENKTANQIGFAEDAGLIGAFDLVMVERVMNWVTLQQDKGYSYRVAANLSSKALADPAFVKKLIRMLDEYTQFTDQVHFEITDAGRVSNAVELNDVIQRIRRGGWKICLDDFGIGDPSMDFLTTVKADMVKFHGSLLNRATFEPPVMRKLTILVTMCRDLGMESIAEGVETDKHYNMVGKMKFDYAQGYLLGRPSTNVADFGRPRRG